MYKKNQEGPNIKRRGRKLPQKQEIKVRVNEMIRYPEVRLVGADGEQIGIVSSAKARQIAEEQGLDLVEVSRKIPLFSRR